MPSYQRDPEAKTSSREVGVCLVLETDDGALVDRRSDDGSWAFTGGTLEDGESLEDALARELFEETGLEIDHATPLGLLSTPSRIVAYVDGAVCRMRALLLDVTPRPEKERRATSQSLERSLASANRLRGHPFRPVQRPTHDAFLDESHAIVVA